MVRFQQLNPKMQSYDGIVLLTVQKLPLYFIIRSIRAKEARYINHSLGFHHNERFLEAMRLGDISSRWQMQLLKPTEATHRTCRPAACTGWSINRHKQSSKPTGRPSLIHTLQQNQDLVKCLQWNCLSGMNNLLHCLSSLSLEITYYGQYLPM